MKKFTSVLILCSILCVSILGYKLFLNLNYPNKYKQEILHTSQTLNVNASLIASVINVESSFNKNAKSNKNALGLMQIKLTTAQYMSNYFNLNLTLTEEDLFIPTTNIYFGTLYLHYLSQKFSNQQTIIAAYNAGETRVRSWLKSSEFSLDGKTLTQIPYKETNNYIKNVEKNLNYYKKIYK